MAENAVCGMRAAKLAMMMQAQVQPTPDGAIVFDPDAVAQAAFDPEWFEPEYWRARAAAQATTRRTRQRDVRRRAIRQLRATPLPSRRHGGARIRRPLSVDRARTHAQLRRIPPAAIAARKRSAGAAADSRPLPARGPQYRADILTRRVEQAATLAELIGQGKFDAAIASRVGAEIARFHAQGVYHADLNAHNILLTDAAVWLIDFDRGELRHPARTWQQANLARLRRSLLKIGAARKVESEFERDLWQPLMAAWEKGAAS